MRNRSVRGATRTQIRSALPLIGEGRIEEAQAAVREAVSALDKAVGKGVIHPNNAARRKSRLMLKLNAATVIAAAVPAEEAAKPARKSEPARKGAKKAAAPAATAKTATRKAPAKKAPAKTPTKTKAKGK